MGVRVPVGVAGVVAGRLFMADAADDETPDDTDDTEASDENDALW